MFQASLAMDAQTLIETLATRHAGGIAWIQYNGIPSGLNASAKREGRIIKSSLIPIQLASYENRAAVKQAVASGEREAPQIPDYLEFVSNVAGGAYIARHKGTGKLSLRAPMMNVVTSPATYTLDGVEVPFDSIKSYFTASALAEKPTKADFNEKGQDLFRGVNLENIVAVK
jgi:hypothetical protein